MDKYFKLLPVLLWVAIGVALLFPVAALGTKFGWWDFRSAFALLGGAAMTGAVLLALSGVGMLMALARKNDQAKQQAVLITLVVLMPLGVAFYFGVKAGQVPEIHDVSTDSVNPPQFQALLTQRPADANPLVYDAQVAELQAKAYPQITSLHLESGVADAFARAVQVAEQMGWDIVSQDADKALLEATDTTFWFGFVDDVVVRITVENGKAKVDVRSASRVGRSDIGKNAERIGEFLARMSVN